MAATFFRGNGAWFHMWAPTARWIELRAAKPGTHRCKQVVHLDSRPAIARILNQAFPDKMQDSAVGASLKGPAARRSDVS